jgi:hypothetical protein
MNARIRQYVAVLAMAAGLAACSGTARLEAGRPFDPAVLESVLRPGVSSTAEVRAALGEPYGQGGALLPFHDGPRTTWTYFHESGMVNLSGSSMDMADDRTYLFVFFKGDIFDSYLWFPSALRSASK